MGAPIFHNFWSKKYLKLFQGAEMQEQTANGQ